MRILIDSGSYHALNVGDVAMLQAAVERLRAVWPDASIAAVTNAPQTLASCCPGVSAVPLAGRVAWSSDRFFGRADRVLPSPLRRALQQVEDIVRRCAPTALSAIIALKRAAARRDDSAAPLTYLRAIRRADLVVATGAGVFTDAFLDNALGVLTTLALAQQWRIPTALTGQGLGPVISEELRHRMRDVLRRVDLIALRERHASLQLLHDLGVDAERVVVTGDDALEMASRGAAVALGDGIGVNVRVAGYAGTTGRALDVIAAALPRVFERVPASPVPIPIAHHPDCHDGVAISQLIGGTTKDDRPPHLPTVAAAIAAVSRCRVVLTGSYHAAVFALAQGIPVVAVAASPYYVQKFAGLADLFAGGCTVCALDAAESGAELEAALVAAWDQAPARRASLRLAAAAQIDQGRAAYRRLAALVCRGDAGAGEVRRSDRRSAERRDSPSPIPACSEPESA